MWLKIFHSTYEHVCTATDIYTSKMKEFLTKYKSVFEYIRDRLVVLKNRKGALHILRMIRTLPSISPLMVLVYFRRRNKVGIKTRKFTIIRWILGTIMKPIWVQGKMRATVSPNLNKSYLNHIPLLYTPLRKYTSEKLVTDQSAHTNRSGVEAILLLILTEGS